MDGVEVLNKVKEVLAYVTGKAVHSTTDIWTSIFSTSAYTVYSLEDTGPFSRGRQVLFTAHLHMDDLNEDHTAASRLEFIEQMVYRVR